VEPLERFVQGRIGRSPRDLGELV